MAETSAVMCGHHIMNNRYRSRRVRRPSPLSSSPSLAITTVTGVLLHHYRVQHRFHSESLILLVVLCFISTFLSLKVVIFDSLQEKTLLHGIYYHPTNRNNLGLNEMRQLRYESSDPKNLSLRQRLEREISTPSKDELFETVQSRRVALPASIFSPDPERDHHINANQTMLYNVYDCPLHPPKDYPVGWNAIHVLRHWNPDQTTLPSDYLYQSICVFDWEPRSAKDRRTIDRMKQRQQHTAIWNYRHAEVPFIIRNQPDVAATSYRWTMIPDYLPQLIGDTPQRTEYSKNNHLMFWRLGRRVAGNFVPPTENVQISFPEWLARAETLDTKSSQEHLPHWYFRLNAALPNFNAYLYEELPIFQPYSTTEMELASDEDNSTVAASIFMVDSTQQRGINCRFGMKGSIAEMYFDPTRNWIVVLRGMRRYILADPEQCPFLALYPNSHPSGRHSSINWSTVGNSNHSELSPLNQARVSEVVLQAGEGLYLPTAWFHFIVSLNTNYQCNARSGVTLEQRRAIQNCGFDIPPVS
jgi:Cupin-like domain